MMMAPIEGRILAEHRMEILTEDDIVRIRRKVHELAVQRGFDTFAAAAVTTATSELSRNIFVHAGRGLATICELTDGRRFGLRIQFADQGPGISDLERSLAGGYSSGGSLGLGLSGSQRLVDDFRIESTVGDGTVVEITKWTRFP